MHGLRTFCVIFCLQMSYCPPNMDRDNNEPPVKKCQKKRPPCGKCCSVWGCNNSRRKDRLGVFSFPKPEHEPERHAEWVRVVRQTRADFRYHPSSSFICADHFPEESISNLTKIRLLSARNPHDNTPWKLVPGAVPIISKLPPRPRLGSTISPAKPKAQSTPTKLTRRRLAAVKRERRRHMDAALHAEAEKMVPPAPAEPDELGEPSNGPDHPDYIFLKVEDNLEGNLESNHKEPVSESTMSNKKLIETVDGLVIKEESDNIFVADNDMMEKVKEEREDEMIVWKIEDDVTFKEESLDMDMEDDSHPYEDCEDPLLTLKCKSCEEVCATRSDLETHTKDKHGSGEHPRGQKRKKLVKSKHDKLYDHGKSSCDKAWDEGTTHGNSETEVTRSGEWKQLRVSAKKKTSQERSYSVRTKSHSNQEEAVASEKEGGSAPLNSSLQQPGYTDESSDSDPPETQPCRTSSTAEGMATSQLGASAYIAQAVQNQRLVATLLSELVASQKQLMASQKEMVALARDGVNAIQEALELFKK